MKTLPDQPLCRTPRCRSGFSRDSWLSTAPSRLKPLLQGSLVGVKRSAVFVQHRQKALLLTLITCLGGASAAELGGELRLQRTWQTASSNGPLAQSHALLPAIPTGANNSSRAEAELHGRWQALNFNALLRQDQQDAGHPQTYSRFNELYLAGERGAWAASLGKKIVSWDVGQAFRPNDLVQQEERRTLYSTTLEGRELLQLEHYGNEQATSLVWVQPQRLNQAAPAATGPDTLQESAWAARHYQRLGALDLHGFARVSRHSGPTLGAAAAWVADEAWSLSASARWLQRHSNALAPQAGATHQLMLGASWAGEQQQSLMFEAWHDGSVPTDAQWQAWQQRNSTLINPGSLANQAAVMQPGSLRQNNLYARLAWQPGAYTWALDTLWMPTDHGRILTLSGQWQGDRWKLYGALRRYAGPRGALVAQLPQDQAAVLALVWPF